MAGLHRLGLIICAGLLAGASTLQAQPQTMGRIIRLDPRLDDILDSSLVPEVIAAGFTWSEGPVWVGDAESGHLLFSDIPRNSVYRWDRSNGVSLFLNPSGYTGAEYYGLEPGCNGLLLDKLGQLVACEHGDRRVSVLTHGGGKRTLVDNYQGKRLNSPNDGCFHSDGSLYFTDPPYGLPNRWDDPRRELDFCGVYRLATDGTLTLLTKEMTRPNGIALSPDEKTLYVAQSDPAAALWKAFPVLSDGTLGQSRLLYDATELVGKLPGLPDGLKADKNGYLFATGPGGVHIFNPDGTPLGRIDTGQKTANCGWGEDGGTLFMTADSFILRLRTKTKGAGWE